jgi:hypothetical protein
MGDTLKRYRAVRDALKKIYPKELTDNQARRLNTLASMISGIIGSQSATLPDIAGKSGVEPYSHRKPANRESRVKPVYDTSLRLSANGGTNWGHIGVGASTRYAEWIYCLALNPENTDDVYIGTEKGIFWSSNGGKSWFRINTGLTSMHISSIVIDPADPQAIYAGTDEGVFKTNNGGLYWIKLNSGLPSSAIVSLAIDPVNTRTIYAITDKRCVYKNINGGR